MSAAILLSLPFFSFNFMFFAWCGFVPLFAALQNKSLHQSFKTGYLCGIIFWSLTVYWLVHVTFIGQAVLILYLAVYFGIFGVIIYFSRYFSSGACLIFVASSWVLLEYIRSYLFTGFPWALISLSQYKNLPVIQIADITGSWGVSFLVVLVNTALYLAWRKRLKAKSFFTVALILFLSLVYGFVKLSNRPNSLSGLKTTKVSVIQGNIPQDLKWDKHAVNFIQNNYQELTVGASGDDPDLIIWPEASVPGVGGQDDIIFSRVFSLAQKLNVSLLVGAVTYSQGNYFNSALFIDRSGQLVNSYSKLHLVPFGEYVPFKSIFPFLETIAPIGDIRPGRDYTIFELYSALADFGVLICFEDLFPELSREFVKRGASFLVNITNDAWYKEGSAPYQHFAASVFRAVENRVTLVRCANTGLSGFIDPFGMSTTVADKRGKEIFVKGYSSQNIHLAKSGRTFYNRYGDIFIILCLLLDACVIIFTLKSRRTVKNNAIV